MAHKRKGKKKQAEKIEYHQPLFIQDLNDSYSRPVIGAKNPWLYPENSIGKMETGIVRKSETSKDENLKRIVHVLEL